MNHHIDHPHMTLDALSENLVEVFTKAGCMIACAESCTGGMISAAITDIAGSSAVLDRGFVTYSNDAKQQMLGVDAQMIEKQGAVSGAVAAAMAEGALAHSNADLAISVTGIAGPGGGSDIKPVGLVWFACATGWGPTFVTSRTFADDGRDYIRFQATMTAMQIAVQIMLQRDDEVVRPPDDDLGFQAD